LELKLVQIHPKFGILEIVKIYQLSVNAVTDHACALYQLAHECVHLLSPTGAALAPVLEEGLATVYSENYIKSKLNLNNMTNLPSYINAATKVRQLLDQYPDAINCLRKIQPAFSKMTINTFSQAGINVDRQLTDDLLSSFVRG
jgi:hypothetical protein